MTTDALEKIEWSISFLYVWVEEGGVSCRFFDGTERERVELFLWRWKGVGTQRAGGEGEEGKKERIEETGESKKEKKKKKNSFDLSTRCSFLSKQKPTASRTPPPPAPPSGRSSSRPGPGGRTCRCPRRGSTPLSPGRSLRGFASARSSAAGGRSRATLFERERERDVFFFFFFPVFSVCFFF